MKLSIKASVCFGILFSQLWEMLSISDCDVGGCACACVCLCMWLSAYMCSCSFQLPQSSAAGQPGLPRLLPDQLQVAGWLPWVLHFCILQSISPVNSQQVTEWPLVKLSPLCFAGTERHELTPWKSFPSVFKFFNEAIKAKNSLVKPTPTRRSNRIKYEEF